MDSCRMMTAHDIGMDDSCRLCDALNIDNIMNNVQISNIVSDLDFGPGFEQGFGFRMVPVAFYFGSSCPVFSFDSSLPVLALLTVYGLCVGPRFDHVLSSSIYHTHHTPLTLPKSVTISP